MPTTTSHRFLLSAGSYGEGSFRVREFEIEEGLSECWRLSVLARCETEEGVEGFDGLLGQPACLRIEGEDFTVSRRGIVSEAELLPDPSAGEGEAPDLVRLVVRPLLWTLTCSGGNRIFLNKDAVEIAGEVLREAGIPAREFRFDAIQGLPKREYTVQYNETDLGFVERLMEDEGIGYWFEDGNDVEVAVFAGANSAYGRIAGEAELAYNPPRGLVHRDEDHVARIGRGRSLATGKVTLKDYNDRTPSVVVQGAAEGSGHGELYAYSPHAATPDLASRSARLRLESIATGTERLEGEGICRGMRAGVRFSLRGSPSAEGEYLILHASHRGDLRDDPGAEVKAVPAYWTRFIAQPASIPCRPPRRAARPVIPGLLLARTDGPESGYATIDEDGRYHAKLPFDRSDRRDGGASLPIRLSQPYAGPGYGMHFPIHNGNDLVLGFLNGDADRPVALGAVPTPANPSPVAAGNKSESVIRTASGNILRLDDKESATKVEIATSGEHYLGMTDAASGKGIVLRTTDGHLVHLDDTGTMITVRSRYGHELVMDDGAKTVTLKTRDGHRLHLDDPAKTLILEDGASKTRIEMDGAGGHVSISAEGDMRLSAGGTLSLTAGADLRGSASGNLSMASEKDMSLEAGKKLSVSSGELMGFESSDGVRAAATKGISLEAGENLQLKGDKVLGKAEKDWKSEGAKVTVKSTGDLILKGTSVKQN